MLARLDPGFETDDDCRLLLAPSWRSTSDQYQRDISEVELGSPRPRKRLGICTKPARLILNVVIVTIIVLLLMNARRADKLISSYGLTALLQRFEILEIWQNLLMGDPFEFRCPLPIFQQLAVEGLKGERVADEDCCHEYDSLAGLWPYQYKECGQKLCPSCWHQSSDAQLAQSSLRSLLGVSYAASAGVYASTRLEQKDLTSHPTSPTAEPLADRLFDAFLRTPLKGVAGPGAGPPASGHGAGHFSPLGSELNVSRSTSEAPPPEDIARHAGLPFKRIIAPLNHGLRQHDVDICPQVDDWEQYYMNDDGENVHARVYKSQRAQIAVVSFRGTQLGSVQNWEIDADINMQIIELGQSDATRGIRPATASVHDGFFRELQRVLPHVKKWVEGYIAPDHLHGMFGVPPTWKLVFTGHSMGAALATLAATMAEAEGWSRRPDAVITFGSPRLADKSLSDWWESKDLCKKLFHVRVYNDAVTWMPFLEPYQVTDMVLDCFKDLPKCMTQFADRPAKIHMSSRWQHVCPGNEFFVPGSMKGVNKEQEDFSALGGVLAHFIGNAKFGYGFGVVHSSIPLYDRYCSISADVFPSATCSVKEPLESKVCLGLQHDQEALNAKSCGSRCCNDPACSIWQFMKNDQCWRGMSDQCLADHPNAKNVVAGQHLS